MNSPFMRLAWFLWVTHRLPLTLKHKFKKLGLSSLKLGTVLRDSDAQLKPLITGQIPSLNIYRKQTRL